MISVIINVYNGEKFIKKCIDSVINQTYKELEILIINDGSTDNTLQICEKYSDPRIKIITTKNLGLSMSRNIGIENATGEYLYFIDVDDFIELDTIEYLYKLSKKYDADITTCNPLTIFDYNFKKKHEQEQISILSKKDMLKKVLMLENMAGTSWNKLIKKSLHDNIRYENRIVNDVLVIYKLVQKANKIVYSNQYKYYYLKHKNNISIEGYRNVNRTIDFYKAINERYVDINNIYPNLIENKIGVLRGILKLYLIDNNEIKYFLKENKVRKRFNELFSFKMIFSNINKKEKIKLLLFKISPKLYVMYGKIYRRRYKYKM